MGLFDNPFTGAITGGLLGPAGMIGGMALGAKNQQNNGLDGQMMPVGAPPADLDPNDIGTPNSSGSPYAKLALGLNSQQTMQANDQAESQAAGAAAAARSGLAAHGGITSGAQERLGLGAMNTAANSVQLNNAASGENASKIMMNDENQRSNAYQSIRQQNQQMANERYGSGMMANATLEQNKKKGLLGLNFGPL